MTAVQLGAITEKTMNEEMQTISHKASITRFGLTCHPNWVSDKDNFGFGL